MQDFPTHVSHQNKEYPINTDYRVALQCLDIVNDDSISDWERSIAVVTLLFGSEIPIDEESQEKAVYYLQLGESKQEQSNKEEVLDFQQDKDLIYSTFLTQFNLRLIDEHLHWWEFISLISTIDPETPLGRVISIRAMDLTEIEDHKERARMRKVKEQFRIKKPIKETQELDDFMSKLYG